jgi:hypothetical protein
MNVWVEVEEEKLNEDSFSPHLARVIAKSRIVKALFYRCAIA